jgi:redox-regulated HSP33 family molecular chaperone
MFVWVLHASLILEESGSCLQPVLQCAGVLSVVRSEDSQYTQPYTGMIPIRSGEIAEDFAMYLADSEQTNSAVGLGVAIGTDLSVLAAGGFLVNVSRTNLHCFNPGLHRG